jgi:phosphopantothenoylcysteine synthetase/decarboxylase
LVGFSLESDDGIDRAEAKMRKKGCDIMAFNKADTALGSDDTSITLLFADGNREPLPTMSKTSAAGLILGRAGGRVGR